MEQRGVARYVADEQRPLEVVLELAGSPSLTPVVVDASEQGLRVRFARQSEPTILLGTRVEVALQIPGKSSPMERSAVILNRSDQAAHREFGLRYLQSAAQEQELRDHFLRVFAGRRAVRVTPDPEAPPQASVCVDDGARMEVAIRDISASGVSFSYRGDSEGDLGPVSRCSFSLRLPGTEPMELVADLLSRSLDDEGFVYRAEWFEPTEEGMDAIVGYVMTRQQQMLAEARDAREAGFELPSWLQSADKAGVAPSA